MNSSSRFVCIDGFAEELDDIYYEGISNWFVSFKSLFTVYTAHFSYLFVFFCIIGCGILSYRHSMENGKKYTQFWLGALLQGVVSERSLTATKYWHAQGPIMFFGKQLPLHVVILYPFTIYLSMMAVQRMQLNTFTEPAAVGLLVMLMEIPYRIISVKFLHITYHDTDPLYYHKFCGVPWIEIMSSLMFSSTYVAVYHAIKFHHLKDVSLIWNKSETDKKETVLTVISGIVSPIIAFIQKLVLFYFLHDFFDMNPISCLFFTICVYIAFILFFEPKNKENHVVNDSSGKTYLFYQLVLYLFCLVYLALFGKPQNEISIGTHEPTGDCTTLICSRTPLGKPIRRKKYLCVDDVSARKDFVYNFDCLPEGPPCLNAVWYTICGTAIRNRPQFMLNVLSFSILIYSIFAKSLFSDVKKFDAVRKLIVRFRRVTPSQNATHHETGEVTVGLVLVQQDTHLPPVNQKQVKKKVP